MSFLARSLDHDKPHFLDNAAKQQVRDVKRKMSHTPGKSSRFKHSASNDEEPRRSRYPLRSHGMIEKDDSSQAHVIHQEDSQESSNDTVVVTADIGTEPAGVPRIIYTHDNNDISTTTTQNSAEILKDLQDQIDALEEKASWNKKFLKLIETGKPDWHVTEEIKYAVRVQLFHKVKFICSSESFVDCEVPGSVGSWITSFFHVPPTMRQRWWHIHKHIVYDQMTIRRNYAMSQLGTTWTELHKAKQLPTLDDILKLRAEGGTAFEFFCDHFLPCVAGKVRWKTNKYEKLLSETVTVSDEAMALLILENCWERWEANVGLSKTSKQRLKRGRYTNDLTRNRNIGGWSYEGLERFNAIYDSVESDRESEEGKMFEKDYLKKQRLIAAKNGKKLTVQRIVVYAYNDLSPIHEQRLKHERWREESRREQCTL